MAKAATAKKPQQKPEQAPPAPPAAAAPDQPPRMVTNSEPPPPPPAKKEKPELRWEIPPLPQVPDDHLLPRVQLYARRLWAWMKENDPAAIVHHLERGRLHRHLIDTARSAAIEYDRLVKRGEKPALADANVMEHIVTPVTDIPPQPSKETVEAVREWVKAFEADPASEMYRPSNG